LITARANNPPPISAIETGSGTVVAKKLPEFEAEIDEVGLARKKASISAGVIVGIVAEKPPVQFDIRPDPSVAVPSILSCTEVRLLVRSVKMIGEPKNTEQDWPMLSPLQLVLDDPGEIAVSVKSRAGFAPKVRKPSIGMGVTPLTNGAR
jgi:hypothetical protein